MRVYVSDQQTWLTHECALIFELHDELVVRNTMKQLIRSLWVACGLLVIGVNVSASSFLEGQWPNTDFDNSTIDLGSIMSGGPPKDGIPSIDNPKFDHINQAKKWLTAREPVILVNLNGEVRAYPLQLLIYHEIVNDQIGHTPISVTFCPLCNSSVVFDRRLNGRILDFGTTGLLRKSDMVMYDRQTESWWQQIIGQGIVGKYAGVSLTQIPSSIISFGDFAAAHPNGKVVNRKTGHSRPYGNNPYRGYDKIDQVPFLFRDKLDSRLPPMERVMHIRSGENEKLYPFSRLKKVGVVNDAVGETQVVLFSREGLLSVLDASSIKNSRSIQAVTAFKRELNGTTLDFEINKDEIVDRQTGSNWNLLGQAISGELKGQSLSQVQSGIHFSFAWLAFNPDVDIFEL